MSDSYKVYASKDYVNNKITGMQVATETLEAGSDATAQWDGEQGLLTIGVPQGVPGADGKDAAVDATLTQSGQAADAKVTGDAVSQLKDDLAYLIRIKVLNYIDGMWAENETINTDNGAIVPNAANYYHTDKIEISPNVSYTIGGANRTLAIIIYDKNDVYIDKVKSELPLANKFSQFSVTESNAAYIRVLSYNSAGTKPSAFLLCKTEDFDGSMKPYGSKATNYVFKTSDVENDSGYVDDQQVMDIVNERLDNEVKPELERLEFAADAVNDNFEKHVFNLFSGIWIENETINENGQLIPNSPNYFHTEKIYVEANKKYTVGSTNRVLGVYAYSESDEYIGNAVGDMPLANQHTEIIVPYDNVSYVYTLCYNSDGVHPTSIVFVESELYDGTYHPALDAIYVPNYDIYKLNNWFKGKKIAVLGDSITYQNRWQPFVESVIGCKMQNCGIGGSTVCKTSNTGHQEDCMYMDSRISTIDVDSDVVLFFGGHNDWAYTVPIGEIPTDNSFALNDSGAVDTFVYAYALTLKKIMQHCPNAKIYTMSCVGGRILNAGINQDGHYYIDGKSMEDYANAVKMVSSYYGIPCIDVSSTCGINTLNASRYLQDVIHPNTEGGKLIANCVINYLLAHQPIVFG